MLTEQDRSWQALARAVGWPSPGGLEPKARGWGKVVLLETMASLIGVGSTKLRNYYYRNDPRLEALLLDYAMSSARGAVEALRALEFRRFSPIVWKRPLDQLAASRASLGQTLTLLRLAERHMRAELDPPVELRREVGTVATEVMACALTFFDGERRWKCSSRATRCSATRWGPSFSGIEADAPLFARFWETARRVAGSSGAMSGRSQCAADGEHGRRRVGARRTRTRHGVDEAVGGPRRQIAISAFASSRPTRRNGVRRRALLRMLVHR